MATTKASGKTTAIDELTSAFDLLDLENNGDLDFVEFKIGLQSLNLDLTHEEAIELFESIDADKAGTIDRDSFVAWLKKDINSEQIEDIRNRLRVAISKQTNASLEEEDELEKEIVAIARRQSQLRPELAMDVSAATMIEHRSDSNTDSDNSDDSRRRSPRRKTSKDKNSSRSKSRSKRKHKRSQTNKYNSKKDKGTKGHKKHGTDIPTSGYHKKSKKSKKKHGKHDTAISNASFQTTVIKEEDSTDDDSSIGNKGNTNDNLSSLAVPITPGRYSKQQNNNQNISPRSKQYQQQQLQTSNSFFKSDTIGNMNPNDGDPEMMERLKFLKNQELRRVTREVESRHVISDKNANKFSKDDIKDMANEMLLEMDRLRRHSLTNDDNTQAQLENMNKHVHEFSDSLDANTLGNIQAEIANDIHIYNQNSKSPDDIAHDYEMINSNGMNGTNLNNNNPTNTTTTNNNNNNNNNNNKPITPATQNDEEFDATLIDTIEASLDSKKNSLKLNLLQYSGQSNGLPTMNTNNASNPSEVDIENEVINKKSTLTLDNAELDVEQTGNVDENAPDNNDEDKDKFEINPNGITNNNNNINNKTPGGPDDDNNTMGNGVLRSDTVKGRAGSMTQQFQERSSLDNQTINNQINIVHHGPHGGSHGSHGSRGNGLDRLTSTDALGLRGLPEDEITMMKDLTKKYDPTSYINTPSAVTVGRSISGVGAVVGGDTLRTLPDFGTTRATSHSYDRMMSDHTSGTIRALRGSTHHYPTQSLPSVLNSNTIHTINAQQPIISSNYIGPMGSLPTLPTGHGMLHSTSQQPVLITNTQHSYQPPIPGTTTIHSHSNNINGSINTSLNNHRSGSNVSDDILINNNRHHDSFSKHSDSHHSISLSHHSSLHSHPSLHNNGSQNNSLNKNNEIINTDITHFNGVNALQGIDEAKESLIGKTDPNDSKHWIFRLINWYLEPIHSKSTFKRLLYHGANLAFAMICCVTTVILFFLSIPTLITCCFGLLGLWGLMECSRIFAQFDMQLGYYFFDTSAIPRFSIYIPVSHGGNITTRLRDYFTDPHMLQILVYLMVFKLPSAIALSGVSLVLFAGVTSVLLTPLVFWIEPDYFNDGYFCVFGSKSYRESTIECSGWSVDSFGDTIGAFLVFLPLMPLTLHLCKYTAKLLFRITCHFMTMDVKYKQRIQNNAQNQYEAIDLEPL